MKQNSPQILKTVLERIHTFEPDKLMPFTKFLPLNQSKKNGLHSVEICAGAGGQALGLELAGFNHAALVEIDREAQNTLRLNRPHWNVLDNGDVCQFSGRDYKGVELLAGGCLVLHFPEQGNS